MHTSLKPFVLFLLLQWFLDDLRESWKPEHTSGEAWIEEGQGAGLPTTRAIQEVEKIQNTAQAEIVEWQRKVSHYLQPILSHRFLNNLA